MESTENLSGTGKTSGMSIEEILTYWENPPQKEISDSETEEDVEKEETWEYTVEELFDIITWTDTEKEGSEKEAKDDEEIRKIIQEGSDYFNQGNYSMSAEKFRQAVKQRGTSNDHFLLGKALSGLGDEKEGEEGRELYKRAALHLKEVLWKVRDLDCVHLLGKTLTKLGEQADEEKVELYYEAEEWLREVVDARGNLDDLFWLGRTLSDLGDETEDITRTKNYKEAITHLRKVFEKRGEIEDVFWLGRTLSNLGDEKEDEERVNLYEEAVTHLEKVVNERGGLDDCHWFGATLSELAEEKEEEEQLDLYDKAIEHLRKVVNEKEEPDAADNYWLGKTLSGLGDKKEGKERVKPYKEAVKYLRKAVEQRGGLEDHYWLGRTLSNLGYEKRGGKRKKLQEEGIKHLKKVADERENWDDRENVTRHLLLLSHEKEGYEKAWLCEEALLYSQEETLTKNAGEELELALEEARRTCEYTRRKIYKLDEEVDSEQENKIESIFEEGITYFRRVNFSFANDCFSKTTRRRGSPKDHSWVAKTLLTQCAEKDANLALLHERAVLHLMEAVEGRGNAEDYDLLATALNLLSKEKQDEKITGFCAETGERITQKGLKFYYKDAYPDAIDWLKAAFSFTGNLDTYQTIGRAWVCSGHGKTIPEEIDASEKGIPYLEKVADERGLVRDRYLLASALVNLSCIQDVPDRMKNRQKALPHAKTAEEQYRKILKEEDNLTNHEALGDALFLVARIEKDPVKMREAAHHLKLVADENATIRNYHSTGCAFSKLGDFLSGPEKIEAYENALQYLEKPAKERGAVVDVGWFSKTKERLEKAREGWVKSRLENLITNKQCNEALSFVSEIGTTLPEESVRKLAELVATHGGEEAAMHFLKATGSTVESYVAGVESGAAEANEEGSEKSGVIGDADAGMDQYQEFKSKYDILVADIDSLQKVYGVTHPEDIDKINVGYKKLQLAAELHGISEHVEKELGKIRVAIGKRKDADYEAMREAYLFDYPKENAQEAKNAGLSLSEVKERNKLFRKVAEKWDFSGWVQGK